MLRQIILVFFLIATVFSSCNRFYEDVEGLHVFRYNEDGNITSLDPIYARNQANIWATAQIFNSLVELDSQLNVSPAIAHRWEISDNGLIYTFYLRDDVYFHDSKVFEKSKGRKVVATDFVYSFSRLVDPALNSPGSWVMNPVAINQEGKLSIYALSDTVLQIVLKEPFPPMPGLLCMQYCSVIPHEAIAFYGPDFRNNPVGTGPFYFRYWNEGVKLVFRKNSRYFEFDESGTPLPYLDAIAISFIQDRQTAFLEFIKGKLDILTRIDATYKDELLTPDGNLQQKYEERFYKLTGPFLNTEYLGILVDPGARSITALQQRDIRLAINYGFDREKMLLYLRNNLGTPAHAGFVPVGMPGFTLNEGGYYFNPDKARSLLARAGFSNGAGLPAIELSTTTLYMDIAQYIQHELSRMGIRLQINIMPPATLRETMAKAEAPFFRASWIADYPDAENYLALFHSSNHTPAGPNYTRFTNAKYDQLYEKSKSIVNDSIRFTYYQKLDSIIIAEAPVVPLFYDQSVRFLPHYVQGMQTNPLNHMLLKRIRMDIKD
jgi:ABC-type transport system substrate-binding protein